jgi:hypothetical protein
LTALASPLGASNAASGTPASPVAASLRAISAEEIETVSFREDEHPEARAIAIDVAASFRRKDMAPLWRINGVPVKPFARCPTLR